MTSGDDAALVSATRDTLISNYATVAFVSILVYDYCLTLSREVEYVWKQSPTPGKALFVLNRYLPIVDLLILANSYANTAIHDRTFCTVWFHVDSWLMVVSVTVIDCILLLRTWAIWECSRLIMAGLSALGTLCILALAGATLFADLTVIPDEESRIVRPCDTILPRVNVLYSIWISILVYDTTVMTLTMIRIIPEVKSMVSKTPLAVRVLRDGVQFFLALSLIAVGNIVVLNAAPPQLSTMLFTFHRIMVSTLGSRIILNLRGTIDKQQTWDDVDPSHLSMVVFSPVDGHRAIPSGECTPLRRSPDPPDHA